MSDSETAEKAPLSANVSTLVESIKKLNVMELVELKGALEDEFGVTAAAPAMGMMMPMMPARRPAAATTKSRAPSMSSSKRSVATRSR